MDSKRNTLLASHDLIETELIAFDDRVTSLSQKLFSASNKSEELCLLLHLSVTEGVREMYAQFQDKTKQKMLQNSHEGVNIMEQSTAAHTSPRHRGNRKPDKAAGAWTAMFCEFYRSS